MILAGDIGGTKTYVGLYRPDPSGAVEVEAARYASTDFPGVAELLQAFLSECGHERPDRVVIGVPGPVRQPPVKPVNLPWTIDPAAIADQLGVAHVDLLNDLEATAYGTLALGPQDLIQLNAGEPDPNGNAAVIAAGTGLGEAGLAWVGTGHAAVPSEGGHASFAPGTGLEAELWDYLFQLHGHVSWERVVSGMGLVNIYEFLRDTNRGQEPDWLREQLAGSDEGARIISEAATSGHCELASQALDLFVSLYGAEAGNLALKFLATGGVFIGGGIAPKIADKLCDGTFMAAFAEKGRVSDILHRIPVHIIRNDRIGLLGAAYYGARQAEHP
ncbi:MAG: glucokinase [Gemmatimonadetes bacterium]|jgi:glucokinase|nr:glucokinase [Gemmatimonadota bacterium]MBT7862942.1 glucokinase [Gemmatimonadota bacterium]